jgi:DNA-binding MarR family transcriptional regulator
MLPGSVRSVPFWSNLEPLLFVTVRLAGDRENSPNLNHPMLFGGRIRARLGMGSNISQCVGREPANARGAARMSRSGIDPEELEARTVTLSAEEWADAVHLLQRLTRAGEASQAGRTPDRQALAKRARQAFLDRRRRVAIFGSAMFGESGWDMLLILYVERDAERQTIGRLAELSGVAKSTALRWLRSLEADDLVRRTDHPTDRRTDFVELTKKGESALDSYFSETLTPVR